MDSRRRLPATLLAAALTAAALSGCAPASAPPTFAPTFPSPPFADPGDWSRLPDGPLTPRRESVGAELDDRFLVIGGWSGPPCPPNAGCIAPEDPALRDGAAFDPQVGSWQPIAPAPVPISGVNSVVVGDDLYVLTGDPSRDDSPVVLLRYEPDPDAWTTLPAPPGSGGQLLAGGDTLLAISPTDELPGSADWSFDPATFEWTRLPDDPLGPSFDRDAIWLDGTLILTAKDLVVSPGSEKPAIVRLAAFADGRWSELADSETIGWDPTSVSGLIVFPATGGADGGEVNNWGREYSFGGIYDPVDGSWQNLPVPPTSDAGLTGVNLTVGDHVLVDGHLFEPRTSAWTTLPALPGEDRRSEVAIGSETAIFIWGGANDTENLGDGYLLELPPTY